MFCAFLYRLHSALTVSSLVCSVCNISALQPARCCGLIVVSQGPGAHLLSQAHAAQTRTSLPPRARSPRGRCSVRRALGFCSSSSLLGCHQLALLLPHRGTRVPGSRGADRTCVPPRLAGTCRFGVRPRGACASQWAFIFMGGWVSACVPCAQACAWLSEGLLVGHNLHEH